MSLGTGRRQLLSIAALSGGGLVLRGALQAAEGKDNRPAEVNATEDLMREHGLLNRVLLIYEEGIRRLGAGTLPSADVFSAAARIVERFIENYHEKLEEEQVFPRMEKAGKLVDLTRVLQEQHAAGRKLTSEILKDAKTTQLKEKTKRESLAHSIYTFIRMYRPHEAREDTVLFPAFHSLFTEAEFDKLGDEFERREHQVLGEGGFEGILKEVAQLEKMLGIYDLSVFTPRG
jgi:hemerythrin-like domain-containing protein